MSNKTLGNFKLFDPNKNLNKVRRSQAEVKQLEEEIFEFIRENPRCSREDIEIKFDLAKAYAYVFVKRLLKAERIFKVRRNPDHYHVYAPVRVIKAALNNDNADVGASFFSPKNTKAEKLKPFVNQDVVVRQSLRDDFTMFDTFETMMNKLFIEYADRDGLMSVELQAVNEFRRYAIRQKGNK